MADGFGGPLHIAALTLADRFVGLNAKDLTITLQGVKGDDDEVVGDIEIVVRYVKPAQAEEGADNG